MRLPGPRFSRILWKCLRTVMTAFLEFSVFYIVKSFNSSAVRKYFPLSSGLS